jgi:hypothetical protein
VARNERTPALVLATAEPRRWRLRDSTHSGVLSDDAVQPVHEARTWRRVALEVDGMGEPSTDVSAKKPDPNADIVTTRVNVAFPFSQIRIQEP